MRSSGTAQEWERRRRLEVTERSVHRWLGACRQSGDLDVFKAKASPGRPRKLTRRQERTVLGWLTQSPTAFGFAGELWTSRAHLERRQTPAAPPQIPLARLRATPSKYVHYLTEDQ
jgi:transposase